MANAIVNKAIQFDGFQIVLNTQGLSEDFIPEYLVEMAELVADAQTPLEAWDILQMNGNDGTWIIEPIIIWDNALGRHQRMALYKIIAEREGYTVNSLQDGSLEVIVPTEEPVAEGDDPGVQTFVFKTPQEIVDGLL